MSRFDPHDPLSSRNSELSLPPHVTVGAEQLLRWVPCCPRCQVNLTPMDHETGLAWRCPQCAGSSLNFSQFRKLVPEFHADEIWMTTLEQPVRPSRKTCCPECHRHMMAVLIPFQGREVELDICSSCQRLWMESQEDQTHRLEQPNRINISEDAPIRKPPVISVAQSKARAPLREKIASMHGNLRLASKERNPELWEWIVIVLIFIIFLALLLLSPRHKL
jgi:Zn-finger nucleic acid-binding protein